jgi:hypothetical protein
MDEAVGRMAKRASWACDQIAELAKCARSESVRLAALRSMLSDMTALTDFTVLEQRLTAVEENIRLEDEMLRQPETAYGSAPPRS